MFSPQLSFFLLSWRGFLLEGRRHWHAHHRFTVVGARAGYLLASSSSHLHQLTRVARLVHVFFQRGGTVWGFGFVARPQRYHWGRLYGGWRPGVLSNYFFVRIRRVHFARSVTTQVRARHVGIRRPRRAPPLGTRWGRLRQKGSLPASLYAPGRQRRTALLIGYARVLTLFTRAGLATSGTRFRNWQVATSWAASPRTARLQTRHFRRWWRTAQRVAGLVCTPQETSWFHSTGMTGVAEKQVRSFFAHVVTHRQRGRTQRVSPHLMIRRSLTWRTAQNLKKTEFTSTPKTSPAGRHRSSLPRVVARHSSWPSSFPAGVVAGGLTLVGSNLVHEVNSAGVPLLHFGGSSFLTYATVWHVTWNQQPGSLHGVKYLLLELSGLAHRAGLLRIIWRRLISV